MSCREYGFELRAPDDAAQKAKFMAICKQHNVNNVNGKFEFRVSQVPDADGMIYDREDRIDAAARLLKDLIATFDVTVPTNLSPGTTLAASMGEISDITLRATHG